MKEEILDYITSNQLLYLKRKELTALLKARFEYVDVNKIIDELLDSGDLFLDASNKICSTKSKGYLKGKIIGNAKGFGFCKVDGEEQDVFIPASKLNGAVNNDFVLIKIDYRPQDNNPEGCVIKVLKRGTNEVVGRFERTKSCGYVFSDDTKFSAGVYIAKQNFKTAQDGDRVVARIIDFGDGMNRKICGEIVEVLGRYDDESGEEDALIRQFKVRTEFDPATLDEARRIRSVVVEKDFAGREDFRDLNIFTIDGSDTRDVDDAISVRRLKKGVYRVGVHIADVSNYVKPDSALDKEAFDRGTSVYFPDRVLPMLPVELSNGICSLNEGVDRLTLSVIMDLDENANVLYSDVCESVVNVKKHLVYDDVYLALQGDPVQVEKLQSVLPDLKILADLTLKLEMKRHNRGAIDLDMPEAYIEVDDKGDVTNITKRPRTLAHRLIESFMILANETVANRYFIKKTPFVYRVHEKPDPAKLNRFLKFAELHGFNTFKINPEDVKPMELQKLLESVKDDVVRETMSSVLLRSLAKARYAPECLGHYGIASTYYCHFTSPIRRYPDLAIHRMIKMDLHDKISSENKPYLEEFVKQASERSSDMEVVADDAERAVDDLKKCQYMKSFVGQDFHARVTGVQEFGIFVMLDNTVEGLVRLEALPEDDYNFDDLAITLKGNSHSYTLGDEVEVTLLSADIKARKLSFAIKGVEPRPREFENPIKNINKIGKNKNSRNYKNNKNEKINKNSNKKSNKSNKNNNRLNKLDKKSNKKDLKNKKRK
mgnify:FL=1